MAFFILSWLVGTIVSTMCFTIYGTLQDFSLGGFEFLLLLFTPLPYFVGLPLSLYFSLSFLLASFLYQALFRVSLISSPLRVQRSHGFVIGFFSGAAFILACAMPEFFQTLRGPTSDGLWSDILRNIRVHGYENIFMYILPSAVCGYLLGPRGFRMLAPREIMGAAPPSRP